MAHYHNQVANYNEGTAHNPTLHSHNLAGLSGCEGAVSSFIISGYLVMVMSHVLMVMSHDVMEISHMFVCLHMLMGFHYKFECRNYPKNLLYDEGSPSQKIMRKKLSGPRFNCGAKAEV